MCTEIFELIILIVKIYCYVAILLLPIVLYHLYIKHESDIDDYAYPRKEWYRFLKILYAKPEVKKYQKQFENLIKHETPDELEQPRKLTTFMRSDAQIIFGQDQNGNSLYVKLTLKDKRLAEVFIQLRLSNGTVYQLPENPVILTCAIPELKWSAKGLKIDIIEPFKTIKILFNGSLRNCIRNSESDEIGAVFDVSFNFVWKAASESNFFPQQSSTDVLAKTVAMEPWKDANWINLLGTQTGFDQYGMLIGEINIAETKPPLILRLTSCRKRTWGPIEPEIMRRCLTLFACNSYGLSFTLEVKSYKKGCKQLYTGSVITPNKQIYTIDHCNISLPNYFEDQIIPGAFSFNFKAGGHVFKCNAFTHCQSIAEVRNEEFKGSKSKIVKINYKINAEEAVGLGVFCYEHKGKGSEVPSAVIRPGKHIIDPENIYIASLTSLASRSVDLAGQKGVNLALLMVVPKINKQFETLDGFCILTPALEEHIQNNLDIVESLTKLNEICCESLEGNLEHACDNVKALFMKSQLSENLKTMILNNLQLLKLNDSEGATENSYCWAVRTSTVDEDVEKLPYLRNQTFLDCKNDEQVLDGVLKCWGEIYSYHKVQYRRQIGLPIICEMALVIQPIIPAEISGLLTTHHNTTRDPNTMVITANYGLGVSIITESVEPDTVIINRTWDHKLTIINQTSGTKLHKILIGEKGVLKVDNLAEDSKNVCLSIEQIYQVSEVGITLERALGAPKIIEFSYYKGVLYILNVKSLKIHDDWPEFYLLHENDTALMSEKDHSILKSTENHFQSPCSVLTQSVCVRAFQDSLQKIYNISNMLNLTENSVGLNLFESLLKYTGKHITEEFQIQELILTGKLTITEELYKLANRYNKNKSLIHSVKDLFSIVTYCWNSDEITNEAQILSGAIRLKPDAQANGVQLLKMIKRNIHLLKHVIFLHCKVMQTNFFYQKLLLNLLYDTKIELSEKYYTEFLALFYDDIRTDTVLNLELMALILRNMELDAEFCELSPAEGMPWLDKNCKKVAQLLDRFINKFGHRGLNEFELLSEPWGSDPLFFIKMLQTFLTQMDLEKKPICQNENMKGKLFKFLKKKVASSFIQKNQTLGAIALTINKFRIAYKALGQIFVQEGKLPNPDLIFHLNQEEIEEISTKRNMDLISKALKRSKLYLNVRVQEATVARSTSEDSDVFTF